MEADRNQAEMLRKAIGEWQQEGLLTPELAARLSESIKARQNTRQQIAQYFFFIALFCTLLAFGAIFINEKLLERLKAYFAINDLAIALVTTLLSGLWIWYVAGKKHSISPAAYEVYMALGGLSVLTALVYYCKQFHIDATYTAFLSMSLPIFILTGLWLRSKALWIGALILSVAWYSSLTAWLGHDNLFWGMNYPLRFAFFGLLILGVSYLLQRAPFISFAYPITYLAGITIFFIGLWATSIFGNFNSLVGWQQVRQVQVLQWGGIFALAAIASFAAGIKYQNDIARDAGILFLIVNLYTRYFEFFWDMMNKGIFFLVLAITFGLVGWLLEKNRWIGRKRSVQATKKSAS